ncbi:hypothetical protein OAA09_00595 [bacterium]|nr:hypothetical protein [bacterium]
MSGKHETFFVSNSLTGRLTEKNLEKQSEEYKDIDYAEPQETNVYLECILSFKEGVVSCPLIEASVSDSIDKLVIVAGSEIDLIASIVLKKEPIVTIDVYNDLGDLLGSFDASKKKYSYVISKPQETENYRVSLIFN